MTLLKLRGGLLAALMLVACFALAACGGDDEKESDAKSETTAATTTEAAPAPEEESADPAAGEGDFANAANSLCAAAKEEIAQLVEQGDVGAVVARSSEVTEAIAALEPPAGQEEQFEQLIQLAREHDAEAMRIVEDGGTLDDIAALENPEADALSKELGMTECG